jgi:hypothetical protein
MNPLLKINFYRLYRDKLNKAETVTFFLFFTCFLILSTYKNLANAESSKIVKWKDEKGVTHYGDKLPAQDAGRSNSLLNNQGTVIKKNDSFNPNINTQETERASLENTRQDTALLASYTSVEEIDLARARNIKSDQIALETLRQRLNETQAKNKTLETKFSGKKMTADLIADQKANNELIIKLQSNIVASENSITQTNRRFDGYRARYLELRPKEQLLNEIKTNKKL